MFAASNISFARCCSYTVIVQFGLCSCIAIVQFGLCSCTAIVQFGLCFTSVPITQDDNKLADHHCYVHVTYI